MYPEAMISYDSDSPFISPLTAAILEDSGWYLTNSTYVQNATFGKGLGCNFIDNNNCDHTTFPSAFC